MNSHSHALAVFARPVVPGEVKSRLTSLLTPDDAAELYEAFIRDALSGFSELSVGLHVFLAPSSGVDQHRRAVFDPADSLHIQEGQTLGERMQDAFSILFARGFERVVIVGTDLPGLPIAYVRAAFDGLVAPDRMTIGPAEDGGFYALGLAAPCPTLFNGIRFGHRDVFAEVVYRAEMNLLVPNVLPEWFDVDEPADLIRLSAEIERRPGCCPATEAALDTIRDRYGL